MKTGRLAAGIVFVSGLGIGISRGGQWEEAMLWVVVAFFAWLMLERELR